MKIGITHTYWYPIVLEICSQVESLCPTRCYDREIKELRSSMQYLIGEMESTRPLQPTYVHACTPSTLLKTILIQRMRYTVIEVGKGGMLHICSQSELLCPTSCYDRGMEELRSSTQYLIEVMESTAHL